MMVMVVVVAVVVVVATCAVAAYYWRKRARSCSTVSMIRVQKHRPPPVVVKKREKHRANERRDAARRILGELDAAVSAFERSKDGDWTLALEVASAYERGSYPVFRSDPETARALFHVIAASCPDAAVAAHARTRIVAHRMSPSAPEDDAGAPMPRACADRLVRLIATVRKPTKPALEVIHEDPRLVLALAETEPPAVYSDAQNVHDHGVVASLRSLRSLRSLGSLGSLGADEDVEKAVASVLDHDGVSPETKADALEFIERGVDDRVNESLGTSSKAALGAVWKRIEAIEDPEWRSNAVETLALQMADGYNRGHVVCSTGRIARILGALDGVLPDAEHTPIRPTWAVKEEIASLAAKCSAEALGPDEFERRATKTYVDELGMRPEVVASIVGEFKDYVEQQ